MHSHEESILTYDESKAYLSPKKMFDLMKTALQSALEEMDYKIEDGGKMYKVTFEAKACLRLHIQSMDRSELTFDVDLVPVVELASHILKTSGLPYCNFSHQIRSLYSEHGIKKFKAIVLHKADVKKFQLDCPEGEKAILNRRYGCAKKVIQMMKYLRDSHGGDFKKLSSHLLKVRLSCHYNICKSYSCIYL